MRSPSSLKRRILRLTLWLSAAAVAAVLAFAAPSCGRSNQPSRLVNQPEGLVNLQAAEPSQSVTDALTELDALACPEGVDSKLWEELKAALEEALQTEKTTSRPGSPARLLANPEEQDGHSMLCPYKSAATPPTGEANKVDDLGISDNGDGTYTLSWHYRNLGDYGQDGTVGISDITPIAQHFGETYDIETEPNSIQAVVDGSGNGKVDIADVTAIAQNYGNECAAYSVRRSDSLPAEVGDTTELDTAPVEPEQWEERRFFSRIFALPPYTYIAVAPVDAEGTPGELSNVRYTPNHQPVAALTADPTEGDAPLTVNLDASESHDPDGPLAKYEWDWEGDGTWDEDTGAVSTAQHVYETPDFYYPVVRVTDSSGATATAEAQVFAGQWRISTAVTDLFPLAGATSLEVVNGNPAISFFARIVGAGGDKYFYIRANDPLGETWGLFTIALDIYNPNLYDDTLMVVNGRPAIAAMDAASGRIYYSRSDDVNGLAWGTMLEVCGAGPNRNNISMAMVDGRPAVAFRYGRLRFVRALDADGAAWETPVEVSIEGSMPSLAVVNGFPAMTFINSTGLGYVRAEDPDGDAWGEPSVIDYPGGENSSLAVINGKPAIAYETAVYTTDWVTMVKYVIANDENGSSWGTPLTIAENAELGFDRSLMFIQGRPAICYVDRSDWSLIYLLAADAEGKTWRAPMIVSADNVRLHGVCLNEVNGHPAISYMAGTDCTELRFAIYY